MKPVLPLQHFILQVPNFSGWSDPEKIKLFVWYAHRANSIDRVNTSDIRAMYLEENLNCPNVSEILKRLHERKPRVLLKDGKGFYLENSIRVELDVKYLNTVKEQVVEVNDHILPDTMVKGTQKYIENLAREINGCYQYHFYDGSAVLMRRLLESLLIEAFVKASHVDKIRHNNEFMMLEKIIGIAKSGQYLTLARNSDKILDEIKYVGDRSAHSRNYVAHENDIRDVIPKFRTIISELLTLADIHPT